MKVSVIGTGYVGLVAGACLADLGNEVICLDIDQEKIEKLNQGMVPIYEPGLKDVLARNIKEGRISFTTDSRKAIQEGEVVFIAVGTPSQEDGKVDLRFVEEVAKTIGKQMNGYKVIVDKSTVPVGTHKLVERLIKENQAEPIPFDVVSNPEFLREGEAVNDFMNPDRVVVGTNGSEKARKIMENLYQGIARTNKPVVFTDTASAEMIKYASNAMLATRISFMNEIARLCEKSGADVKVVAKGMGLDARIGPRFLQAGVGYGGSCFPKDVKALINTGKEFNVDFKILNAVEDVNEAQKKSLLPKIKALLPDLEGKTIAVWGLAFKPKTDDIREAPSLVIVGQLLAEGARIKAFDPEASENVKKVFGQKIEFCQTPLQALEGAHCLAVVTEWHEFRSLSKEQMKQLMALPNIVDGRNVFEPKEMKESGFKYIGVGRA